MSDELKRAFASAEQTPLLTVEFSHSSFGVLRYVQANSNLTATTENSEEVVFTKSGISLSWPEKTTEGRQDLNISVSNVGNAVYQNIALAIEQNRTTETPVICKFRSFLLSDLSAPSGPVYTLTVTSTSVTSGSAGIRATYTPIPDTIYPRYRYYPTSYPGLRYV